MSVACEPVTQVCLLQYDTAQSRVHNPNMHVRLHLRCARGIFISWYRLPLHPTSQPQQLHSYALEYGSSYCYQTQR